jgi:molecular chaperone GrpE
MSDASREEGEGPPVIRDKRRFDPTTGEVRPGAPDIAPAAAPAAPVADAPQPAANGTNLEAQAAEHLADLQRVQAEYANYRRRVERDRQLVAETALASIFANLLPILDDIDRARAHGEVTGGFALVADGLEATLTKLGLDRFGDAGEPFDPTVHEAMTHGYSTEVTEPVCSEVLQPGYRVGERVLRPARVAVLEPETAVLPDDPTTVTPDQGE